MTIADVDDIDHSLLRMLRADGRRTYSDMAGRVGLSVAAVKRRVDRLREIGVITGFTVQIDHSKLAGASRRSPSCATSAPPARRRSWRPRPGSPRCRPCSPSPGDPDALLWVRARDIEHLQDVIDRMRRGGAVTGTKTLHGHRLLAPPGLTRTGP